MEKQVIKLDISTNGHTAKKFSCPSCGKKTFVKYFNFTTLQYLPDEHGFGRCDREEHCAYFKQPYEWLKSNGEVSGTATARKKASQPQPLVQYKYVEVDVLKRSLTAYHTNNFIVWLASIVGTEKVAVALTDYLIGTAKNNGTIFWQIDRYKQICTGQKIHYATDGHRRKDLDKAATRLYTKHENYTTCFFGEHLLTNVHKGVDFIGLCESEKTAVILSIYKPFIDGRKVYWLASCGMNGITEQKSLVLAGHDIILAPDFSYRSRAVWGSREMRKKRIVDTDGKTKVIVCADGELQEDYISARQRLEDINCKVTFIDMPEHDDGSDFADWLVLSPPPTFPKPPAPVRLPEKEVKVKQEKKTYSELSEAELMVAAKYGHDYLFSVEGVKKVQNVNKQINLSKRAEVQMLANAFNCSFDFKI